MFMSKQSCVEQRCNIQLPVPVNSYIYTAFTQWGHRGEGKGGRGTSVREGGTGVGVGGGARMTVVVLGFRVFVIQKI